jgi:putative NADPH-quinone reductase
MAIFQLSGMEVVGHKYFSSVPNVSDQDRKQMLEELRLLVRDKIL